VIPLLLGIAAASEITVWHAYRGEEREAIEALAAEWGSSHGHSVEAVALPFGAFDSKLETAIPRGNGPDLFLAGHASLGKWTDMGLIEPAEANLSGHLPVTVEAITLDDKQWGVPLAFKSIVLLYDPTVVKEVPRTTDDLIAAAKELTGDGRYGLAYQAAEPYFHAAWVHGFGGALLVDGQATLDTPEQAEALGFARRLAEEEGIAPKQPTAELIGRLYSEGKAAFVISGPWFVADIDRPIAAAPLPIVSETGLPARPYLTVEAAFVATQAKQPAIARDFAEFIAGERGARVRTDLGKQAVSLASTQTDDPLLKTLSEQARTAIPIPTDPAIQVAFEAQARALRDVLRGAVEPDVAARGAQETFAILNRPAPPSVAVWPYLLAIGTVLLGVLWWLVAPLRQAAERERLWRHRWDYLWIGPAAVAMSVLVMVPFAVGASVSLFAHERGTWTFVGLAHFLDILLSRDWPMTSALSFYSTLLVTVLWTVTNLVLHVGIGVALALVLREPWIRLRGVWRALLILPWAVPNYITALIWKGMFHAQYGAINALLGLVALQDGPARIDWFGSFALAFTANLTTNTWLGFPFMMVVTLGALQSIPRELEEAAEMDGASWLERFRYVVWPMLRPALLPAVILGSVWTFNMFNVVFLVSQGEPNSTTEILISEAYRWAFSRGNRYGYASAYAVLIFFVLLAYSRGANRLVGQKVL
jgi:arabinogalactan oligomer / maltooligosaccharide transport system permease protein